MPCTYTAVSVRPKIRVKKKQNKSVKNDILFLLNQMNYDKIEESRLDGKLLVTGSKNNSKIELLFNENGDQFVLHYRGVPSHDEEHQISDKLLEGLSGLGWETSTEHFHDKPKVPEIQKEEESPRREKVKA